mmetsp:Transcript_158383/g.508028  ORF Transcript_158383/g.508028 Transcript_158383/m.508028 type:complete len:266 (-) Transcript_158383:111-908(-)
MALLGAASSAVLQAFETCGLSPTGPHSSEGRAAWWAATHDGGGAKVPHASGGFGNVAAAAPATTSRTSEAARRLLFCLDDEDVHAPSPWADERSSHRQQQGGASAPSSSPTSRTASASGAAAGAAALQQRRAQQALRVDQLVEELFRLHDLNHNGVLEEEELIKLNEKIAQLHYGADTDKRAVREKFRNLFRTELDPNGLPVPFSRFRGYMTRVLDGIDRSKAAQELILEQFVEEAKSGRLAFHCQSFQSTSDEPFRSKIEPLYS